MNTNLMALSTLVLVLVLGLVLVGFIGQLTRVLRRTGSNLVSAAEVATGIRHDCENIVVGVVALNASLDRAAAGLGSVATAARARAARAAMQPTQAPADAATWRPSEPAGAPIGETSTRIVEPAMWRAPQPAVTKPAEPVAWPAPRPIAVAEGENATSGEAHEPGWKVPTPSAEAANFTFRAPPQGR